VAQGGVVLRLRSRQQRQDPDNAEWEEAKNRDGPDTEACEPSLMPPSRSIWHSVHERRVGKLAGPFRRAERGTRKLDWLFGRFRLPSEDLGLREGGTSRTHGPL